MIGSIDNPAICDIVMVDMSQVDISKNARSLLMSRLKVPSVRIIGFFVIVVVALLLVMQTHLTQAKPEHATPSLKTIANIVVHAHHHARATQ
jgi:hypothetical protein